MAEERRNEQVETLDPVWLRESARRAEELASGAVKSVPAAEAFDNAKRSISELDATKARGVGKSGPCRIPNVPAQCTQGSVGRPRSCAASGRGQRPAP